MSIPAYLPEYTDELGERERSLAPLEMTANEQIRYLEGSEKIDQTEPTPNEPHGPTTGAGNGLLI